MVETADRPRNGTLETAKLRARLQRLQAENRRLRAENRRLRASLDAHVNRSRSTRLFGPLELTAGTCAGPGRRLT